MTTFSTHPARPAMELPSPVYDPYAGMKTPGQRQLISLQERVKVGEITVDEAVQEFKAWQFDHDRRANSIRYQQVDELSKLYDLSDADWWSVKKYNRCHVCFFLLQENLKRLRDSITRRHKEKQKTGKEQGTII